MAFPTGAIPLTGFIGTTDSGDVFPTHLDTLQLGGARAVDDNTERDAITLERRKFGMLVYSVGANVCYVLANASMGGADNDLSNNSNWIAFSGGGGPIALPEFNFFVGDASNEATPTGTQLFFEPSFLSGESKLSQLGGRLYQTGRQSVGVSEGEIIVNDLAFRLDSLGDTDGSYISAFRQKVIHIDANSISNSSDTRPSVSALHGYIGNDGEGSIFQGAGVYSTIKKEATDTGSVNNAYGFYAEAILDPSASGRLRNYTVLHADRIDATDSRGVWIDNVNIIENFLSGSLRMGPDSVSGDTFNVLQDGSLAVIGGQAAVGAGVDIKQAQQSRFAQSTTLTETIFTNTSGQARMYSVKMWAINNTAIAAGTGRASLNVDDTAGPIFYDSIANQDMILSSTGTAVYGQAVVRVAAGGDIDLAFTLTSPVGTPNYDIFWQVDFMGAV